MVKINLSDLGNKIIRQELYTANALDGFLVSIPYHTSCQVLLRPPKSLNQAITFANNELNFTNISFNIRRPQNYLSLLN